MKRHPVLETFLKYAAIDSKSGVNKETHPSSPGQMLLIEMIKTDLMASHVAVGQFHSFTDGSFLVRFPGTKAGKTVCYAAHVDTSPDAPGGAKCIVISYVSGDIALPQNSVEIPGADLIGKAGKTIITADGSTTLGADDKAGVAILVEIARDLANNLILNYPPVDLWFCVDEEIGQLDISVVPPEIVRSWDALITLDGGNPAEVDTDCFCGWETIVEFFGQSAHPGVDGQKLKPAHYAMARLIVKIDDLFNQPWETDGMESFAYVADVTKMTTNYARAEIYPRSFDPDELPCFHQKIVKLAREAAEWYGVRCEFSGKGLMYIGTGTAINKHPEMLAPILAMIGEITGKKPDENAVRGGTDGAMVNVHYPNLPAPNLGVGMYNFHGVREFLVVEEMLAMYEIMKRLIPAYANPE